MTYFDLVQETTNFLQKELALTTTIDLALVTGTGQDELIEAFKVIKEIPYANIPNFPTTTVTSHSGKLIHAAYQGKQLLIFSGRFHYYEGYSLDEVCLPIRVLKGLSVNTVLYTNAVGSVNANYEEGDLVVIKDHINLHPNNPLRGKNEDRWGDRFPDMINTYTPALRTALKSAAANENITLHEGVYVGTQGPNLETPAEYRFFNIIGGDVVGMSTIAEVIVSKHMGLNIAVISMVTNKCFPIEDIKVATVDEIITTARKATPKLAKLIKEFVTKL